MFYLFLSLAIFSEICYLFVTYEESQSQISRTRMRSLKLTQTAVDKLPSPPKGKQIDYWDTELKGFGCRVSPTSKTYIVLKRINGKQSRINLGKHGVIKTAKARDLAITALAKLNEGIDINKEKAKLRIKKLTLEQAYSKYLESRPQMRPGTIRVDTSLLNATLSDWKDKALADITREMVARRHLKIAKESGENNANNSMRFLRRIYNFASSLIDGELNDNPVHRLSDSRQWFKVDRRQTVIKPHELKPWYDAVTSLENKIASDYLMLLLLTGLRKNEALSIKWTNVDLKGKTFTITNTKNRKPLTLPMSNTLNEIFNRRYQAKENEYVFSGIGPSGHLVEPKRQVKIVEESSGIKFCLHDLRRTFASVAESLVSYSALKRLMNHTDKDVTQGYIVYNAEKLRVPMQQITSAIMELCTEV